MVKYLEGLAGVAPLPDDDWEHLSLFLFDQEHAAADRFLPRFFLSAVARAMEPGCDGRTWPVIIGPQNRGKSKLGEILFGQDLWVELQSSHNGGYAADERARCRRAWGVELSELNGITRKTDKETLKAFLSANTDAYRASYGRSSRVYKRNFVFWGTANEAPLTDVTGNSRFVCITVGDKKLPLDRVRQLRDHLWARAMWEYHNGTNWHQIPDEEMAIYAEANIEHEVEEPWFDIIQAHVVNSLAINQLPIQASNLCAEGLLNIPQERRTNRVWSRITGIFQQLGLVRQFRTSPVSGKRQWGWWPKAPRNV